MSAPKHTPGPWSYDEEADRIEGPTGEKWVICRSVNDADARLIAAAPDLAEALEALADAILEEEGVCSDDCAHAICGAYRKARVVLESAGLP